MGGTHTKEYVQDPKLTQLLMESQKQNAELHAEFLKLVERIKSQGIEDKIESFEDLERLDKVAADALIKLAIKTKPLQMEGRNYGFYGTTSTGKSTIINALLGEAVAAVGSGETTIKVQSYPGRNFTLHDMPGRNDETSYFSMQHISAWKGLTGRFVVIRATLKEMSKVFRLLDELSLKYDIIVNKLDAVILEERESFKEKIRKEVSDLGLKGVENIWFVSAKNPDQFPDWLKLVDTLTK
ncbi:putative GTP-binding protein EngB [Pseudolycoriella hygida]|uniref:GTP-binding protein EngB n=1 Tax=Pseudolycoriella hygida TaxID=35572 RepID=A0A9Q0N2S6_9DIPT|nr:putative GTP-binding protein EngB [Pseudolycoriella hygida]